MQWSPRLAMWRPAAQRCQMLAPEEMLLRVFLQLVLRALAICCRNLVPNRRGRRARPGKVCSSPLRASSEYPPPGQRGRPGGRTKVSQRRVPLLVRTRYLAQGGEVDLPDRSQNRRMGRCTFLLIPITLARIRAPLLPTQPRSTRGEGWPLGAPLPLFVPQWERTTRRGGKSVQT